MRTSWLAALLTVGVCMGCSDSSAPTPTFSGSYQLTAVNGQSLPVTFGDSTLTQIRWVGGSVTALPQSHFARQLIQQFVENGDVQQTDTGLLSNAQCFYQVHGATVQFYDVLWPPAAGPDTILLYSGTLSNDNTTLSITEDNALAGVGTQLRFER